MLNDRRKRCIKRWVIVWKMKSWTLKMTGNDDYLSFSAIVLDNHQSLTCPVEDEHADTNPSYTRDMWVRSFWRICDFIELFSSTKKLLHSEAYIFLIFLSFTPFQHSLFWPSSAYTKCKWQIIKAVLIIGNASDSRLHQYEDTFVRLSSLDENQNILQEIISHYNRSCNVYTHFILIPIWTSQVHSMSVQTTLLWPPDQMNI